MGTRGNPSKNFNLSEIVSCWKICFHKYNILSWNLSNFGRFAGKIKTWSIRDLFCREFTAVYRKSATFTPPTTILTQDTTEAHHVDSPTDYKKPLLVGFNVLQLLSVVGDRSADVYSIGQRFVNERNRDVVER